MLQRIQTIYLIIAGLCMSFTLYFSFATYTVNGKKIPFNSQGFTPFGENLESFPLYIIVLISSILIAFSIMSFKNRKRQTFLNTANYLVIIALLVLVFASFNAFEKTVEVVKDDVSYGAGMFFPITSLVMLFMANRAVKKDEELIKSMDRIR